MKTAAPSGLEGLRSRRPRRAGARPWRVYCRRLSRAAQEALRLEMWLEKISAYNIHLDAETVALPKLD